MGDRAALSPRHAPWAESADFRIGLRPIAEAARLAAFASAWASAPEAFRAYKRLDLYDDLVAGFLLSSAPSE
jgi:hypothetical protein